MRSSSPGPCFAQVHSKSCITAQKCTNGSSLYRSVFTEPLSTPPAQQAEHAILALELHPRIPKRKSIMNQHALALTLTCALSLALPALADETSPNSARNDQNTAGTTREKSPVPLTGNDATAERGRAKVEARADDSKVVERDGSKALLAPHALMIRASLESALSQVKGMKSQLNEVPFDGQSSMMHFQSYENSLKSDLKIATIHQAELKSGVSRYPDLASSEEFRNIDRALTDIRAFSTNWSTKSTVASYWQNKDQAMIDLKDLEKRLNDAIDKTRSFSTAKLDLNRSLG